MKHDAHLVEVVRRMKGEGVRNAEIAMAVGMTVTTIQNLCHRRGIKKPTAGRLEVPVGARMIQELQAEADRRGLPFHRFVRRLLRMVLHPDPNRPEQNLFAAIFDDGK